VGLALAAVPVGTIAATFAVRSHGDAAALLRRVGALAVVGAVVGCTLFAFGTGLPLVLVAYGAVGVVFASSVPANTLAGRRVPDASRAGVFAILQGLVLGSQALGALVGGMVAGGVSAPFASSAALLVVAVVGLLVLRASRRTTVVPMLP
jgi:MFS family permease